MRRIVTVFLLITMATTLAGARTVTLSSPPPAHPAGCHDQGPMPAPPGPIDHQCCTNAHHAAIPTIAVSRDLMTGWTSAVADVGACLASLPALSIAASVISTNSPPGTASLRI